MEVTDSTVVAAILTLVGVIAAAIIAGQWNVRAKRLESMSAPYAALAARVEVLEASDVAKAKTISELQIEVDRLRRRTTSDGEYIVHAVAWIRAHAHLALYPTPVEPAWVHIETTTPEGHA